MHRLSLLVLAAIAAVALAVPAGATAKPTVKTCKTSSQNVIGEGVTARLTASNVNEIQKRWATCGQAKKAINHLLAYRVEEPKSVAGYYCTPTVHSTSPDDVSYKCLFRAADNPMFVKLTFRVKFDLD
ncbi:MAG TPA: hypothetical protein VK889_00090 [Solirubrobacterales bacterium]|nr:hypothetical protein [Solirubrobacterales bacterium]